jgi:hypothetical protein
MYKGWKLIFYDSQPFSIFLDEGTAALSITYCKILKHESLIFGFSYVFSAAKHAIAFTAFVYIGFVRSLCEVWFACSGETGRGYQQEIDEEKIVGWIIRTT